MPPCVVVSREEIVNEGGNVRDAANIMLRPEERVDYVVLVMLLSTKYIFLSIHV